MLSCVSWLLFRTLFVSVIMYSDPAPHDDPALLSDTDSASNDDPGAILDPEPASYVDPSAILEPEPASYVDPGAILDSPTHRLVPSSENEGELVRCVNCGVDVLHRRRRTLELLEVQAVIRQWTAPQVVTAQSLVCHSCWMLAFNNSSVQENEQSTSSGHRRQLCVNCRCSILRTRYHVLCTNTERETHIRNVISEWIAPRQVHGSDRICHPCWQRADRVRVPTVAAANVPALTGTITLPDYTRAADTQNHCFCPDCDSPERLTVPIWLRVKLFTDFNYYVPKNCRICRFHLQNNEWDQLLSNILNPNSTFTVEHVQDFATFVKERNHTFHFHNIEAMSDDMVHFWIGLSKTQFINLKASLPRLSGMRNGTLALTAYLIKLRTGDSDERISSLLNIPRSTLSRIMAKARDILNEDFIPHNLGINHISRAEISNRNLIIPNGLFGGDDRKPIIIIDGTYLYVQKSSNYLYQKNTYSLHKYRNLVKPFLMVCSDGYIIDVLGPYPATTSDANIISHEFRDESNALRQYFQVGDVFILDRGFRDCVPLLEQCHYSVHMPASLQEGETQLSTLAANKSRTVTICRWVVEAVNGIFKHSFKIFRHEFFNLASKHAMIDFRVAAALINKFHLRVRDREDANQILEIVNERLYMNNTLADFVIQNNLNRRRTQFMNINVNINNVLFPRLTYSDLILFGCGTYQLKQARSYYGEHIRNDGSYTIEICMDPASNLLEGLPLPGDCTLLRGRIQSRHISRKIYFVYILFINNQQGREAINQYCCNCLVGRRTVGCCAHVMTIIWYLSWARHEHNITPPAQFLDNILITYDSE